MRIRDWSSDVCSSDLRFATASLARPRNGLHEGLPASLALSVIDVREETPPAGESAVHWRLLTTHAVADAAEAFAIADLYRRRWAIEQLFRTLQTQGFDIEGLLVEDEAPLRNLVMAPLTAATTLQQLVHPRDGHTAPPRPPRPHPEPSKAQNTPPL